MAVYQVQAPDGKVLEIEAPEGASQEDILAYAAQSYVPEIPEDEPEDGILRQAADVPVGIARGGVQGVRFLADALGADNPISQKLQGAEEYLGKLMSASSQRKAERISEILAEAEDKGALDQVFAGLEALTVAPVDLISQAFGTAAPALVGGLFGMGLRTAAVISGGMGAGITKSSIYEATKSELLKTGLSEDEAEARAQLAQQYDGQNLDQILLGTGLGAISGFTGIERAILPDVVRNITQRAASKSAIARAGQVALGEAAPEFLQAGQERVAANIALQREGFDVDTFQGALPQATLEGLVGGLLGGGVGALSRAPTAPEAPPVAPPVTPVAPPVAPEMPPVSQITPPTIPGVETPSTGLTPASFMSAEEARVAKQQQAVQQFGLAPEAATAPEMAQVTPSQVPVRQPSEPIDPIERQRQAMRVDQLGRQLEQATTEFDRQNIRAQIDQTLGVQEPVAQARFADLSPMDLRTATGRLNVLRNEVANQGGNALGLNVVPHPSVPNAFAIENRPVEMDLSLPTPDVSPEEAQARIEAAEMAGRPRDPSEDARQVILSRALQNIEDRGGVASPEEAEIVREANLGQPYDRVDPSLSPQGTPEQQLERQTGIAVERAPRERLVEPEAEVETRTPAAPAVDRVIAAMKQPAPTRSAEDVSSIRMAQQRYAPEDVRLMEQAARDPESLTEEGANRLNNIRLYGPRFRLADQVSPGAQQLASEVRKKLLPQLRKLGLGNVGLRLVEMLNDGRANGMYFKQVITLALDSDNPLGVMRHEVIHALKELGAFTDAEWKALTKRARGEWINRFLGPDMVEQYRQQYLEDNNGDETGFQEYIEEEAIAEAFRFFEDTKPPAGMIQNLMRRLKEMFNAIKDFFAGNNLTSEDIFLSDQIFREVEQGRMGDRVRITPQAWQATNPEIVQADQYALENGIEPYLSEGQLELDVPVARYSLKQPYTAKQVAEKKGENHPIFGLPMNKNGTITLYLPTNNVEARRIVKEKKLKGDTPNANRIYLTNESSGPKIMQSPGNIDHRMDGANVMIQVDPAYLQLDQEFEDGRKDFFIQIAEGEAFAEKMALTKLFTMDAPRERALSADATLSEIEAKIAEGVEQYKNLSPKEKRARLKQAKNTLKQEHNVGTLLSENGKLQKTRVGDYGLKFEGNSVASMGLGLASAQKINDKLSSCPRSARCESLCLGETSGQNLLYGGDGQFKSGPRLSQYLKTEAMVLNPEAFGIVLYDEIKKFESWAKKESGVEKILGEDGKEVMAPKQVYQPAIRLNVTSDFAPKVFESIINSFPDVEFYDYTKLNTQTIAPNHHLTYSSDGVAQEIDGKVVGVGSNWKAMTRKLDNGHNVAMAFTSRKSMPEFLLDEATGQRYQVWNGDNYDARFLDPKPGEEGNLLGKGMIIGLTNKDRTGKPEDAALKNDGFFVDYDPARDGKTLVIKDQSRFTQGAPVSMPISRKAEAQISPPTELKRYSLRPEAKRAIATPQFKRWFGKSTVVDKEGKPKVMYHGTARDITEFRGKQAGAIFVTEDPIFAESFSGMSEDYMVKELFNSSTPEQRNKLIMQAAAKAAKDGNISKTQLNEIKRDFSQMDVTYGLIPESIEIEINDLLRDQLASRANIMPVYVRAERPFDYANPEHVAEVGREGGLSEGALYHISMGSWNAIESPDVQAAIKDAGFDGFYILEAGRKNLAVYQPNQIKSATGNIGTYDESGDVRYSLVAQTPNAPPRIFTKTTPTSRGAKAVVNDTIETMKDFASDQSMTNARIQWVDRYAGLSKRLKDLPLYDPEGTLRADMLKHAQSQIINLVKTGIVSGIPFLNRDGTISIQRTDSNLSRSEVLAEQLGTNKHVIDAGMTGKNYVAEIARALVGEDIINEDKRLNALGVQQLADAKQLFKDAKALAKAGKMNESRRTLRRVAQLRKDGYKNKKLKRELQVDQTQIDWAKKQLDLVPEVKEILDIWRSVSDSLVTLWRDTGLLSEDQAQVYLDRSFYVPLFKAREDLNDEKFFGLAGVGAKSTAKLKQQKGSEAIRNIWENLDKQYASMVANAYENQTRRVAVQQLQGLGGAEITNPSDPRANLKYKDDGKVVSVIVDEPTTLTAFQTFSYELGPIMKAMGAMTRVLRAGALINPMFWLRQLIRDPIHATLVANSGVVTPFHAAGNFVKAITDSSPEARILAERGVIGQVDSTVNLQDFLKDVGRDRLQNPSFMQKTLHKLLQIHESSDAATRVSVFKRAKEQALKKGYSEEQAVDFAVFKARESINFGVMGMHPMLNSLRQMVPFLNATIVGLDTLYRAATGYGLNPEERAEAMRQFRIKAGVMVALSTAYALMYQDDEDYKKLPDYVKDNNFLIPLGTGEDKNFIKLAIPYEVGFLFKTVPEVAIRYLSGTSSGKEMLASYWGGLLHNLPTGGVPIPQAVRPGLEVITNYSFFTGRPIEGMSEQGLPTHMRGQRASEFAKTLSRVGLDKLNLSPAEIDYLIQGYFAELGTFTTELASSTLNFAQGKEPPEKNLEEMPFFRSFMTNPNSNKAVADFYEITATAQETSRAFNTLLQTARPEEAQAYIEDEEKQMLMAAAPALRKIRDEMAKIRKTMSIIQNLPDLSAQEKRQQMNDLQKVFMDLAGQGVELSNSLGIR